MSVALGSQKSSTSDEINQALGSLVAGAASLAGADLAKRLSLLQECLGRVGTVAGPWVEACCAAKGIAPESPGRGEEIIAGPGATARQLRLLIQTFTDVLASGRVRLPRVWSGPDGALRVQVVPARGIFDGVVFAGFRAACWLDPAVRQEDLDRLGQSVVDAKPPSVALVLGAGNVSSIAPTDVVTKIFQERQAVLLKMNPVNDYLGPILEQLFEPIIALSWLRIIYGGVDVGTMVLEDDRVLQVHITGSIQSHDAIVWGATTAERERRRAAGTPALAKPITSELGNVSPWIIVPGPYSDAELKFQAENVAASIVNNASFNCVATKVIVTQKQWPQREQFLGHLDEVLARVGPRRAYYPGARERFRRFSLGQQPQGSDDTLPWTILRGVEPGDEPHLFREESFVCVAAETALDTHNEREFLSRAAQFANEQLWGTLAAAVTVSPKLRRDQSFESAFQGFLESLRYGAIGVNHWPGLIYAMMSPPWGGCPGSTLADAQSGIGHVHNTYLLRGVRKTVLEGPITIWPKPVWFPSHRNGERLAWRVLGLYLRPSVWKLPGLAMAALAG